MLTEKVFRLIFPLIEEKMNKIKNSIIDYSIFGSSSGHYGWKEVRFCDFDIWIFCRDVKNIDMLSEIRNLIIEIKSVVENYNIILLADAVNGPYKPEIWEIKSEDILFLHLLIDDEISYNERSIFTKLSWSKYEGYYKKNLLTELLDRKPTEYDLLNSKCGILNTLNSLRSKIIRYNQINLFTGLEKTLEFNEKSAQYIEFILHSIMMISRNRARLMKRQEADILENNGFAEWYEKTYHDCFIRLIVDNKVKISNYGYGIIKSVKTLEEKSISWLENLKNELEKINEK